MRLDSGTFTLPDASSPFDSGTNRPADANVIDPGFDAGPGVAEDTDALCSDGQSNDGDPYVDCDDYDCSRNPAVTVCASTGSEDTDPLCSDGQSNDGDPYVDCDDFDCTRSPGVTVCNSGTDCATCTEDAMSNACSTELAACARLSGCQGLLLCVTEDCSTGDSTCIANCRSQSTTETLALFDELIACMDAQCGSLCP
ncbi:MAG: hypothetical protein HYV07_27400 [Deltaproteobacteria bacterium]|nr:hypothetical protein [Deltaproteobacteria bacterium]